MYVCVQNFQFLCVCVQDFQSLKRQHGLGEVRKVVLSKGPEEGLGMSITVSIGTSN